LRADRRRLQVEHLVNADPTLVAARRSAAAGIPSATVGSTLLHIAAAHGEHDIAQFLIAHGADINAPGGSHGATPLHAAAVGGHPGMVDILLRGGANVTARDAMFR
jgi:ankyrin repeat protein